MNLGCVPADARKIGRSIFQSRPGIGLKWFGIKLSDPHKNYQIPSGLVGLAQGNIYQIRLTSGLELLTTWNAS